MQQKNIILLGLVLIFSIVIINTLNIFAATKADKTDCKTSTFTQGLCNITQQVCVTFQDLQNADGIYDHIIVWEKVTWDCGLAGKGSKSGNTYEGDFKFRDTNNLGYFNNNPSFDPSEGDSLVTFVATPIFDPSNPDNTFYHTSFEIAYRDKNSSSLTGVFGKELSDITPLYISYKQIGPAKMNGNWNTELFEEVAAEFANIFTNITPVIYPNPSNGVITISINDPMKDFLLQYTEARKIDFIKIINMKGELVYSESDVALSSSHQINVHHLPAGTYFLKVFIGNLEGSTNFILNK